MVGLLATVVRPAAARRLLRYDRDHVVAVDDFAGLGARQPPARAPQHACWLGLAPDVGKRRWPAARQRLEASMLAAESLPDWNDLGSLGVTRPDYRDSGEAGVLAQGPSDLHLASLGCGVGSAGRTPSRPGRAPIYRLIWRPALAEIVGDGRPWTVPMISLLSMPCR